MREELKALRDRKLDEATFEDKLEIVSKLGIKVYPAEDLKSMRVACQLNLEQAHQDGQSGKTANADLVRSQADGEPELAARCRKVHIGPPLFLSQTNNYLLENDLLFCQHDIRHTNPLNVPAFDGIIAFKYIR